MMHLFREGYSYFLLFVHGLTGKETAASDYLLVTVPEPGVGVFIRVYGAEEVCGVLHTC